MKLFSKKKKDKKNLVSTENEKIKKSKEIIKKEKAKIKAEKKKKKQEKQEKFYQTKLGKILKKIFFIKEDQEYKQPTIKGQILSMLYFEIMGAIICLLILFALSGGKNYFKLYKELNKLIDTYDTITTNYKCNSAIDEHDTSFDISGSDGVITDSNGNTLSTISLADIHIDNLTQYNTETRII